MTQKQESVIQTMIRNVKEGKAIVDRQETGSISEVLLNLHERKESLKESKKEGNTHIIAFVIKGGKILLEGNLDMIKECKDIITETQFKEIMSEVLE